MDDKELDKLFDMEGDSGEEKKLPADEPAEKEETSVTPEDKEADELPEDQASLIEDEEESDTEAEEEPEEPSLKEQLTKNKESEKAKEKKEPKEKKEKKERPKLDFKPSFDLSGIRKIKDIDFADIPMKNVLLVFLGLVFAALIICFFTLPFFRVLKVNVNGNVVLSKEQILSEAGLSYNSHLFKGISGNPLDFITLNYGKTCKRMMKENPYYEELSIRVSFPSTINIDLKERSKVSYVRTPDGYAALDMDGVVLELSSGKKDDKDIRPVICGLETKDVVLGRKIVFADENDYKKGLIVLGAILSADMSGEDSEYSLFEHTIEVRVLPSGLVFLTIETPSGAVLQVKLDGIDHISKDMEWLLYSIKRDAYKGLSDGALDLTGKEQIYRDYRFRE